jgi:outer membrane protein assembly factor BamB
VNTRRLVRIATLAAFALMIMIPALAQDWPQWRGANRDGAGTFTAPATWPERLQERWKVEVGLGYATPLVVGDRIYMFTRQGEEEVMQALDAAAGKQIWRTAYAAPFQMNPATARHGPGPKSTPTFANGRLFSFGMTSIVTAYDAATGKQLWQKPATKAQPMYHTAMSPLVDGNSVIIHVGGAQDTALTAYDVANGNVQWTWTGDSPAYGSPIVADLGGTRQVVVFTNQYLVGVSRATGELLWRRPFTTPSNTTAQTPIVYRDMLIQAGRENGITAFRPARGASGWTTENVWQTKDVSLHMTNGVAIDGVLYGLSHLNAGQYFALDLNDGKVLWMSEGRQAENAGMVRSGNTVLSLEDDGELVVFNASRTAFTPVHRYKVSMAETWAQPAISGNRIFVKDVSTLALWSLS